jgi:polar amino acid transport system substrate-binding protein
VKILFVLLCIVSCSVKAANSITFAVGHDHQKMIIDYPFYAASWEILNVELTNIGYTVKTNIYPWARAKESVKKGKSDGLFLAANFKGRESWASLSIAIGQDHFGVFQNHRSDPLAPFGSVRLLSNYSQLTFLDQNKQINVTTAQEGLLLLSNQKLQGFIMSRSYGDYLLHNELHTLNKRIVFNEEKIETYTAHIAVGKTNPERAEILSIVNKAIGNAFKSDSYKRIMQKHGVEEYQLVTF